MIQRIAAKVSGEGDVPLFTAARRQDRRHPGDLVRPRPVRLLQQQPADGAEGSARSTRLKAEGKQVKFWCYGRKAYAWLQRRGYEVERFFVEPPLDKADFAAAKMVADELWSRRS